MKIVVINGSPRPNGTCSSVLTNLLGRFNPGDHEIHTYPLNAMNIRGCQECYACRHAKTDNCAIKDDLSEVLENAKSADLLVVATPVFYADVSAQLKCFIDRTWSYFGRTGFSAEHLPRNRKLIFIQSYGYMDATIYNSLFEKYRYYFEMFGFNHCYPINAYGAQWHIPEISNKVEVEQSMDRIVSEVLRN